MFASALFIALSFAVPPKPSVRIGNLLVSAPNGISVINDDDSAIVVDFGGDYVAGIAAPDDSYHAQKLSLKGANVLLEWGRSELGAVGRLTSDRPITTEVRLRSDLWPGFETSYSVNGSLVHVSIPTRITSNLEGTSIEFEQPLTYQSKDTYGLRLDATGACHFRIAESVSGLPSKRIDAQLDKAKAAYLKRRPTATGDWGDFVGAIADNMNNSRIYASDEKAVAHSVSRGWAGGNPNNAPFFCWDSFFNGALACLDDPETARSTVRAILGWQTPEGMVPNFGHWQFDKTRASNDRSQPPVGSLCVWKMHMRWPDMAFLKEVYPKLLKWHRWWPKNRDGDHNGLLEWGSSAAGKQGALWETGWDDTPEYAESEMVGNTLDTDAVDLNSLYAMDAENLAYIADAVGEHTTAKELRDERVQTIKLINKRLWNPDLGIYCSRKWDSKGGKFLTRLTPMNFYPLIAGAASPDQAKKVLKVMTDPKRFWGKWILPTVPYDDPLWPQQAYWHGTVWAPVNFLVFQGLRRYAPPKLQAEFAAKGVELCMRNWNSRGWCGENFGSGTGVVNGDKHYTWGALMCLVGLESICAIEPNGSVTLNGAQTASLEIANVPIHGHRYTVKTGPGWASLLDGGRTVFTARGGIANHRI